MSEKNNSGSFANMVLIGILLWIIALQHFVFREVQIIKARIVALESAKP